MPRQCTVSQCGRPHVARGYCGGHYKAHREGRPIGPLRVDPIAMRLPALIRKGAGCWEWLGGHSGEGYGRCSIKNRSHMAHRVVYEHLVGPIPPGLVIDHTCRNHGCVNPAHMEPVTNVENVMRGVSLWAINARKTHCKREHPFDEVNTLIRVNGNRACRACARIRTAEHRARKRLTKTGGER